MYRFLFLYISVIHAELEMVQVLVRHGDRAPSFTYPLDNTFEVSEHFPRGFSQLTKRGFEQAKEVGIFLRKRYEGFITKFDRQETLIRSSDKDRCIETAMGISQTLFPEEIVPIHTFSNYKQDLLLKPNSVRCRRVEEVVHNDKRNLADTISKKYQSFLQLLSENTGWDVTPLKISDVFNVLHRKEKNGIPQPEWVYTVLGNVTELKRQIRTTEFNSAEKSKLRTGFLLGQLSKDLNILNESRIQKQKKLIIYATHDATLTSLMYSMGISDHQLIPYTASLIIELHRINGKRYVKILYRLSNEPVPTEKLIPLCDVMCPLEHYNRFVAPRSFTSKEEFDSACGNYDNTLEAPTRPSNKLIEPDSILSEESIFSPIITFASLSIYDLFSFMKTSRAAPA